MQTFRGKKFNALKSFKHVALSNFFSSQTAAPHITEQQQQFPAPFTAMSDSRVYVGKLPSVS